MKKRTRKFLREILRAILWMLGLFALALLVYGMVRQWL